MKHKSLLKQLVITLSVLFPTVISLTAYPDYLDFLTSPSIESSEAITIENSQSTSTDDNHNPSSPDQKKVEFNAYKTAIPDSQTRFQNYYLERLETNESTGNSPKKASKENLKSIMKETRHSWPGKQRDMIYKDLIFTFDVKRPEEIELYNQALIAMSLEEWYLERTEQISKTDLKAQIRPKNFTGSSMKSLIMQVKARYSKPLAKQQL